MCISWRTLASVSFLSKSWNASVGVKSAPAMSRSSRAAILRLQVRHRRRNIGADALRSRLLDMRLVIEALSSIAAPRCAAEIVDRDRVNSRFGEPLRELL